MDRILYQHNPSIHLALKNATEPNLNFLLRNLAVKSVSMTILKPCKATFVVDYISTWEIFQTMEYTHEEKKGNGHNQLLEWFCCTCHPLHIVKVSIRSDAKGTCTTSQVTHGWVNSDLHCWHMYMFPNKVIVAFSISFLLSSIKSLANIRLAQSCINAENQ